MRQTLIRILLAAVIALPIAASADDNPTSHVTVTASVSETCVFELANSSLPFGTYDPVMINEVVPLDAQVTVEARCTSGYTQKVLIDQGLYAASGSTDAAPIRQMAAGVSRLPYNIYTTSARNSVWGNTSATGVPITGQGTYTNLVLYGRIAAGIQVAKGNYTDTVLLTFSG
jgi:spore coat protein U-like protein